MHKKRVGDIIVPPGAIITRHEKLTADYIAVKLGWDVTFLVPDRRQGVRTPDVYTMKYEREIKVPVGKSSRTIENNLREALRQSPYIILDLRRMDGRTPTHRWISEAERLFKNSHKMKHLMVITRQEEHIDFERK